MTTDRTLLRTSARIMAISGLGFASTFAFTPIAEAATGPTVLFVVDTSDSMTGTPLAEAQDALRAGIAVLGSGQSAGLRSYGGDCGDGGSLLVSVASSNAAKLKAATDDLTADGGTPTPDALRAAAADLPKSGPRTIILISDGESTCGDPCIVAQEIKKDFGVDFKIHTVGFNAPENAVSDLTCISKSSGGSYYQATDGASLAKAVSSATEEAVDNSDDSTSDSDDGDSDDGATPVGGVKTGAGPLEQSSSSGDSDALFLGTAVAAALAVGAGSIRWAARR